MNFKPWFILIKIIKEQSGLSVNCQFFALLVKKGNVNCTEAPKEAYSCKCTAVFKNTINFFKDF